MFSYTHTELRDAEARATDLEAALPLLRRLPLDDFGAMMFFDQPDFPRLKSLMPPTPSEEVQRNWCGATGETLYLKTSAAVRAIAALHQRVTGRDLGGARILDYGCGWGRLARMMLYFTDPENLHGVDAWAGSLNHLRGVPGRFSVIEAAPTSLGFEELDCIYAFSILTHLPPEVVRAMLGACRASVSPQGSLLFTIRPREFWVTTGRPDAGALEAEHDGGFAFTPQTPNGLYGDASYTLPYMETLLGEAGWRLAAVDRVAYDPYHVWICAAPA